ncbi:MAG: zinc ribbon domain-containing protein [Deltaproteobacteria bacterium]|nr:zinc ribbon domain-containing protein [Deltaproteobacteria bacterium]
MPLYEYICEACGHEFEEIQKFSDKPIKKCPSCGKSKAERKVSQAAFHLKGGGWYKDGYSASGSSESKKSAPTENKPKADKKTTTS